MLSRIIECNFSRTSFFTNCTFASRERCLYLAGINTRRVVTLFRQTRIMIRLVSGAWYLLYINHVCRLPGLCLHDNTSRLVIVWTTLLRSCNMHTARFTGWPSTHAGITSTHNRFRVSTLLSSHLDIIPASIEPILGSTVESLVKLRVSRAVTIIIGINPREFLSRESRSPGFSPVTCFIISRAIKHRSLPENYCAWNAYIIRFFIFAREKFRLIIVRVANGGDGLRPRIDLSVSQIADFRSFLSRKDRDAARAKIMYEMFPAVNRIRFWTRSFRNPRHGTGSFFFRRAIRQFRISQGVIAVATHSLLLLFDSAPNTRVCVRPRAWLTVCMCISRSFCSFP